MSENQKTGPVTTVTAIDRDIDENARLTYTLKESDRTYFSIETIPPNAGVLTVFRVSVTMHRVYTKTKTFTVGTARERRLLLFKVIK